MPVVAVTVSALLVAAVSAGHVPPIPAGHRAEYNLLLRRGGFKYGFDTGTGQTAQAEGDANNEVRGGYSYESPAGTIGMQYSAGVGGFVPSSSSSPSSGAVAPSPAAPGGASDWQQPSGIKSSWSSRGHTVQGPIGPLRPDGSYVFSYSTGDQSRMESGDAANNVRGSFSFRNHGDGVMRTVNYVAGAGTGFVAQGAHLPLPPLPMGVVPSQHMGWGGGPIQQQWSHGEGISGPSGDASYKFGYQTGDASRQEVSDQAGNIQGSYSFVTTDGMNHRVDYEAGAGKGFVATGDILPKDGGAGATGPSGTSGPGRWQAHDGIQNSWQSSAGVQQTIQPPWQGDGGVQQTIQPPWQGDGGVQQTIQPPWGIQQNIQPPWQGDGGVQQTIQPPWQGDGGVQQTIQPPWQGDGGVQQTIQPSWQGNQGVQQTVRPSKGEPANTQSSQRGDGSYSFSYSTPDQSRHEAGDARGNVQGSFSFVAKDDGQTRRVDYHAGAGTGFVAKGEHLPKPQPSEVQPAPGDIHVDGKVALEDDDTQQTVLGGNEEGSGETEGSGDASYHFSYQTDDSSRQESSDAKGNVRGSFSFVAPDGVSRRVDYEAGAGKGFVAKGEHLPKEGDTGAGAVQREGDGTDDEQQTQGPLDEQTTLAEDETQVTQAPWSGRDGSGDASYSYSYATDTSRKQETADSAGNVQGSYSYIDASGETKTVTYTARKGEGFKATGDHIPKPGQFLEVGGDVHGGPRSWARGGVTPKLGVKTHSARGGNAVVEQPVGDGVLRTYLPPHGVKAGYVFEARKG